MRILLVNPNTTESMTRRMQAAGQAVAGDGTEILAINPKDGPPAIEGYFDQALSVPGLLREVDRASGVDGFIVGCFDDTGLDAARCRTAVPVIGIGEAAFHLASLLAVRFGVVTTLARSIPAIEHNLLRYGLSARCSGVRASEVPVLELEQPESVATDRISYEIGRAISDDHAEAIVLGCAGMVDLAAAFAGEHGVPVIDGVSAAVKLVEALVAMGHRTSKVGAYAPPRREWFR